MHTLQKLFKKINISCPLLFDEPLSMHTSFKIGGPAPVFARPGNTVQAREIFSVCLENNLRWYAVGHGSNVLVSDKGLPGVVISFEELKGVTVNGTRVRALSGTRLSDVVEEAQARGLGGLHPFHAMPGSVGGAIWMNARCYGASISDILESVQVLDRAARIETIPVNRDDFSYKKSPFQGRDLLILEGTFRLAAADPGSLRGRMDEIFADRVNKGHFLYPCAGSVFKNNRDFGRPTGELIDSLGLKGYSIGGARVSERHANIIINTGSARARDVKRLVEYIQRRVRERYGFELEREIIYLGEI
jgi:UDP-N-acetylmuramate dehydrogenase